MEQLTEKQKLDSLLEDFSETLISKAIAANIQLQPNVVEYYEQCLTAQVEEMGFPNARALDDLCTGIIRHLSQLGTLNELMAL